MESLKSDVPQVKVQPQKRIKAKPDIREKVFIRCHKYTNVS